MNKEQESVRGELAGGKDAFLIEEQIATQPIGETNAISLGKFADEKALLKAYNELESEFTKRSQRLKELERENNLLKQEQTDMLSGKDEVVHDETGSAAKEREANSASYLEDDGEITAEVCRFLRQNPEAAAYAEAIALKAGTLGDAKSGVLERAYIEVLKDQLQKEREMINDDFIYTSAKNTPEIKERIIRDYLSALSGQKSARLLSGGGESVVMPPNHPKNIAEAGEMATLILRKI